jgi:hypothetical protein
MEKRTVTMLTREMVGPGVTGEGAWGKSPPNHPPVLMLSLREIGKPQGTVKQGSSRFRFVF